MEDVRPRPGGPVPVRPGGPPQEDLVARVPDPVPDLRFRVGDGEWLARKAGAGCYGTGRRGTARLVAVHFFRADEPDRPDREALMPAGTFAALREEELIEAWSRATPIVTER
jgi:hypothetical protein